MSLLEKCYLDGIVLARTWFETAKMEGNLTLATCYEKLMKESIHAYEEKFKKNEINKDGQ